MEGHGLNKVIIFIF